MKKDLGEPLGKPRLKKKWQPIETAPKDGTSVLLFGRGTEKIAWPVNEKMPPICAVGRWYVLEYETMEEIGETGTFRKVMQRGLEHWKTPGISFFVATHWAPLPPPPSDVVSGSN
jgi:hypothetical protein